MKRLLVLLALFCMFGCGFNHEKSSVGSEAAYNVNIYDAQGEWYENGLLIESFDNKTFVKMDDGRYELLPSDKEEYRFKIEVEDETLYVK